MYLDGEALRSDLGPTADLLRHTRINLQDVTDSTYSLELFLGNQNIKLELRGSRTCAPIESPYVPCFFHYLSLLESLVCRDIFSDTRSIQNVRGRQKENCSLSSAKVNKVIDPQGIFKDYWGSDKREFIVPSQS